MRVQIIDSLLYYILCYAYFFTRHAGLGFTSLPHATSQDVLLDDYRIPSDAIILADLDSINSDRKKWMDPEVFRPHRFINKDGSLLSVEEFTPFFLGNVKLME